MQWVNVIPVVQAKMQEEDIPYNTRWQGNNLCRSTNIDDDDEDEKRNKEKKIIKKTLWPASVHFYYIF